MKIFKIITAFIAVLTFSSCNDWLDVEPSTSMDRTELFNDENGYADAMSGIYASMCSNSLYGKNMTWYLLELMGGTAYSFGGYNQYYQQFFFHPNTPYMYFKSYQNSTTDVIWNSEYNVIANINSMLSEIDKDRKVFIGDDYDVFKGEALGLRAFVHFDILRLFSDAFTSSDFSEDKTYIPYVKSLSSDVYPLLTARQACNEMLTDLKEAKELLKKDPMYLDAAPSKYLCSTVTGNINNRQKYNIYSWHNRRLHFNYYAVIATMARIYLWEGDNANALACAKEVIDAQQKKFPWVNTDLIANVNSNSTTIPKDRVFSTEHIFALNVTDLEDKIDGYLWEGINGFASSSNVIGINTDYCFDAATRAYDPRYVYLKEPYQSDYTISTKLWKDKDQDNLNFPWAVNRLPLIRISEMYYIAAEACPNVVEAQGYLEQVRRHRGLTPYPLSCATKEDLQQEIDKEYRKEFISEGQMFYYKKRRNESITNVSRNGSYNITPAVYTMQRPDNEDTYGGRN